MTDFLPNLIKEYGYFAIYLLMWVETFLPIFPSELVMPLGGLIASQGGLSLVGVALAGTAGSVTGALAWYGVARVLGYDRFKVLVTRYGRITTVSAEEIEWLRRWFDRIGPVMVLVGRVIPGIRTAVSIPAGLVRMPFTRFFVLTVIGALISNGVLASAGWMLRSHYDVIEHYAGPVATIIVALAVLLWLARLVRQSRHRSDEL